MLSVTSHRTSWTWVIFFASVAVFPTIKAQKAWVSLPVTKPADLLNSFDSDEGPHVYAPAWIGNPPQLQHLTMSLASFPVFLFNSECISCSGNILFEPTLSSTFEPAEADKWPWDMLPYLRAQVASDDISFEGTLTSPNQVFAVADYPSDQYIPAFKEGSLGLAVSPHNETENRHSLLYNLNKDGKLLNPVIGMKLWGENPRLSIGALDPADYEGEINWVQSVGSDPAFQTVIPVEAMRGRSDQILPFTYPLDTVISTLLQDIYIPDNTPYFLNEQFIGPQSQVYFFPDHGGYAVKCDTTVRNRNFDDVYLPFSVDINGVNYPVDSKDLIRPRGTLFGRGTDDSCRTALKNSTARDYPAALGLTFLRSVYLAYRFPTEDCPFAHFGFAYPAGANRTSATLAQKPRTTPTYASQCLQLTTPTSTPSPKAVDFAVRYQNEQFALGASQATFEVWGRPDDSQTPLRGVEDLPEVVVAKKKQTFWW